MNDVGILTAGFGAMGAVLGTLVGYARSTPDKPPMGFYAPLGAVLGCVLGAGVAVAVR